MVHEGESNKNEKDHSFHSHHATPTKKGSSAPPVPLANTFGESTETGGSSSIQDTGIKVSSTLGTAHGGEYAEDHKGGIKETDRFDEVTKPYKTSTTPAPSPNEEERFNKIMDIIENLVKKVHKLEDQEKQKLKASGGNEASIPTSTSTSSEQKTSPTFAMNQSSIGDRGGYTTVAAPTEINEDHASTTEKKVGDKGTLYVSGEHGSATTLIPKAGIVEAITDQISSTSDAQGVTSSSEDPQNINDGHVLFVTKKEEPVKAEADEKLYVSGEHGATPLLDERISFKDTTSNQTTPTSQSLQTTSGTQLEDTATTSSADIQAITEFQASSTTEGDRFNKIAYIVDDLIKTVHRIGEKEKDESQGSGENENKDITSFVPKEDVTSTSSISPVADLVANVSVDKPQAITKNHALPTTCKAEYSTTERDVTQTQQLPTTEEVEENTKQAVYISNRNEETTILADSVGVTTSELQNILLSSSQAPPTSSENYQAITEGHISSTTELDRFNKLLFMIEGLIKEVHRLEGNQKGKESSTVGKETQLNRTLLRSGLTENNNNHESSTTVEEKGIDYFLKSLYSGNEAIRPVQSNEEGVPQHVFEIPSTSGDAKLQVKMVKGKQTVSL